jgi:hypothetical protein
VTAAERDVAEVRDSTVIGAGPAGRRDDESAEGRP